MTAWLHSRELAPIIALVFIALGVWTFVVIASEVLEGDTTAFDRTLLLAFRNPADISQPLGPPAAQEAARDMTALGGVAVLTLVLLAVVGYLYLIRKFRVMLFVVAAVGGGMILSTILKDAFARPRPDLVPHGSIVFTASFPSGHSMLSAVTYLTLGALLARLETSRLVKAYFLVLAIVLTVLVGISRVYLGVHWPTDVLAGWTAGGVWALLCWIAAYWLQRRGHIE